MTFLSSHSLSGLTESRSDSLYCELSELGVGHHPERCRGGGHDQPKHGDLPLSHYGDLQQHAGKPDHRDEQEDGEEPDGEAA